jgi:acyl carrier protein
MIHGTTVGDQVVAICEKMSGKEANTTSRLDEDLDLDSLDRVQLAMEVEDHFGIVIPDEEVEDETLGVVSGLIARVEAKLALQRQGAEL